MYTIAILGFGTVGRGVAELLTKNAAECRALGGEEIKIKYILDRKPLDGTPFTGCAVGDIETVVSDPEVGTVIEAMGGLHPVYEYSAAVLKAGKNLVTSNKEAVAEYGCELLSLAERHGGVYRFEAAVGGGIPVVGTLIDALRQNRITGIRGILNGTTNYILTRMNECGAGFSAALAEAQERGYAERDPSADVDGHDTARKIAILAALASGVLYPAGKIYTEGIREITAEHVRAAADAGYAVKLVGEYIPGEKPVLRTAPALVPAGTPLSVTSGVYNSVQIYGEPIGDITLSGQGSGAGATASAVVGDLMRVMRSGRECALPVFRRGEPGELLPVEELVSRWFISAEGGLPRDIAIGLAGHENVYITRKMPLYGLYAAAEAAGAKIRRHMRICE